MGMGKMVTAAYPVYDTSTNKLISVAGVDVLYSEIAKLEANADNAIKKLMLKSKTCSTFSLTDTNNCKLELLRGETAICGTTSNYNTCKSEGFTNCTSSYTGKGKCAKSDSKEGCM